MFLMNFCNHNYIPSVKSKVVCYIIQLRSIALLSFIHLITHTPKHWWFNIIKLYYIKTWAIFNSYKSIMGPIPPMIE